MNNVANPTDILSGERVRIRPWNYRDDVTQRSWPHYNDPFHTLWNIPRSISLYNSLLPFGGGSSSRRMLWAIDNREGQLIGRISLRELEQRIGRSRLGISLGAPFIGQGLGTEALILFLDHYFGPLDFSSIVLDVAAFNRRAVQCYERLGFQYVSEEWRKSTTDSCLRTLNDPIYQHLRPYFRRERQGVWVQFLEMELGKSAWLESGHLAARSPADRLDDTGNATAARTSRPHSSRAS